MPEQPSAPAAGFVRLLVAVVTLGIADSLVGAYLVLFLADEARLSPTEIGLLFSVPAIPGILVSLLLGRRFDRSPGRRWCLVACAASATGYALMTVTDSFAALMVVSIVFLALYQAVYPQIFAIAATALGSNGGTDRSVPALRSAWSVSWAVGPLVGGALLATIGYTGLFLLVAALLLATMLAVGLSPLPPQQAPRGGTTAGRRGRAPARTPRGTSALLVAGVALFFTSMFAGSIALPLFVTDDLGLPAAFVGWLFSACAVVEVLVALLLVAWMHRVRTYNLVVLAGVAMVGHFVLVASSEGPGTLLAAQVPRGIAVAVMTAAGLRHFQERFSPRVGFATTLFSAAVDAGLVLSGVFGGLATGLVGARGALVVCGVLSASGLLMTVAVRGPDRVGDHGGVEISDDGVSRWEARTPDGTVVGFADYVLDGDVVVFPHTVVDPVHRGRGIAGALAEHALADARARGRSVVAACSFFEVHLRRHPEHQDLVAG